MISVLDLSNFLPGPHLTKMMADHGGGVIRLRMPNKTGGRLRSVISINGVNVVSGETAGIEQTGDVFSTWERHDIAGWRKSQAQVAAFFFTQIANSYTPHTGRPDDVGVIGVALFREKPAAVSNFAPPPPVPYGRRDSSGTGARESAWVEYTAFQRAQDAPDEVITVACDSRENLVAKGVIGEPRVPQRPRPFPGQPEIGFVADPPRTW